MFKFPVITLSILTQAIKSVERERGPSYLVVKKPNLSIISCIVCDGSGHHVSTL